MMCQYRCINCNKFTILVGDIDNGGGYGYLGAEEAFVVCNSFVARRYLQGTGLAYL